MKHKPSINHRRHTYKDALRQAKAQPTPTKGWRVIVYGANGVTVRSPIVAEYMDAVVIAESLRGTIGGKTEIRALKTSNLW